MAKTIRASKVNYLRTAPQPVPQEITEKDQQYFNLVVTTDLTSEQIERVLNVNQTYPMQNTVIAVHWHPEHIPINLVSKRIGKMFPNRKSELIIPTQHNIIIDYKAYSGVEVDCY